MLKHKRPFNGTFHNGCLEDSVPESLLQFVCMIEHGADISLPLQMHFWKGAKFAGSVGHPMTKMLSASGGLRPPNQGLRTRHSAPNH